VIREEVQFRVTSGEEPALKETVRILGLEVHGETIALAMAEPNGEVRSLGMIANRAESIRKLVKKLGPSERLKACYEAGLVSPLNLRLFLLGAFVRSTPKTRYGSPRRSNVLGSGWPER
jgi:hypothetical protein